MKIKSAHGYCLGQPLIKRWKSKKNTPWFEHWRIKIVLCMFITTLHEYILDNYILKRVDKTKDLGVLITPSLCPQEHIAHISGRAKTPYSAFYLDPLRNSAHLRFWSRWTNNWYAPHHSGVWSVIWSPYQLNHINQSSIFNTVFKDVLSRIYFNLPHGYSAFFARTFDVNMRIFFVPSDWWMATKRHIDCPALLSSIDLSIPKGTRSRLIFCRHYHLTSYAYNSKISRLFRTGD